MPMYSSAPALIGSSVTVVRFENANTESDLADFQLVFAGDLSEKHTDEEIADMAVPLLQEWLLSQGESVDMSEPTDLWLEMSSWYMAEYATETVRAINAPNNDRHIPEGSRYYGMSE